MVVAAQQNLEAPQVIEMGISSLVKRLKGLYRVMKLTVIT